jgi:hypothetical protein
MCLEEVRKGATELSQPNQSDTDTHVISLSSLGGRKPRIVWIATGSMPARPAWCFATSRYLNPIRSSDMDNSCLSAVKTNSTQSQPFPSTAHPTQGGFVGTIVASAKPLAPPASSGRPPKGFADNFGVSGSVPVCCGVGG